MAKEARNSTLDLILKEANMDEQFGKNFEFVKSQAPSLYYESIQVERHLRTTPAISLSRLRVMYEEQVDKILRELRVKFDEKQAFIGRLKLLRGRIPSELWESLENMRSKCNQASHSLQDYSSHTVSKQAADALHGLSLSKKLEVWFEEKIRGNIVEFDGIVLPPMVSLDEWLRYAHDGDKGAAFEVAKYHYQKSLDSPQKSDFHRRVFEFFLNESANENYAPAMYFKAEYLAYLGQEKDKIHDAIYLLDELIKQGEVIGVYHDKAIALERLNRTISADTVALQGADAGDPYAMNLVYQWAGYSDRPKIDASFQTTELLERSLEIVFDSEAAYFLANDYKAGGRVNEAIELLERCLEDKDNPKQEFIGANLALLKLSRNEDSDRACSLLERYAMTGFWSALNVVDELLQLGDPARAFRFFEVATRTATDTEIVENYDHFAKLRDVLLESYDATETELSYLVECLGQDDLSTR